MAGLGYCLPRYHSCFKLGYGDYGSWLVSCLCKESFNKTQPYSARVDAWITTGGLWRFNSANLAKLKVSQRCTGFERQFSYRHYVWKVNVGPGTTQLSQASVLPTSGLGTWATLLQSFFCRSKLSLLEVARQMSSSLSLTMPTSHATVTSGRNPILPLTYLSVLPGGSWSEIFLKCSN